MVKECSLPCGGDGFGSGFLQVGFSTSQMQCTLVCGEDSVYEDQTGDNPARKTPRQYRGANIESGDVYPRMVLLTFSVV